MNLNSMNSCSFGYLFKCTYIVLGEEELGRVQATIAIQNRSPEVRRRWIDYVKDVASQWVLFPFSSWRVNNRHHQERASFCAGEACYRIVRSKSVPTVNKTVYMRLLCHLLWSCDKFYQNMNQKCEIGKNIILWIVWWEIISYEWNTHGVTL